MRSFVGIWLIVTSESHQFVLETPSNMTLLNLTVPYKLYNESCSKTGFGNERLQVALIILV